MFRILHLFVMAGLLGVSVILPTPVFAAKDQAVLPRKIVQVAEIPLVYRDADALDYRYRGRLLYWEENGVRIYVRLEDIADLAARNDGRCPFDSDALRLTLHATLNHIPDRGDDVDLHRFYSTFIVGVLRNDERAQMARVHDRTMDAWDQNLQDVMRVLGSAAAQQAIQCMGLLGRVAAQNAESEEFYDRIYWRQETLPNGKNVKYFFAANNFFVEEDK